MSKQPDHGANSANNRVSEPTRRIIFDRMLIARASSGIGALALVLAVLAFLLQHDITPLVLASTVIGIVGIVLWTLLAPDDLRGMIRGRQAQYGSNSILSTILVIGIVAVVYTLTVNSGVAADLTTIGYYSLNSDVKAMVDSLDRPIQITAFYNVSKLSVKALDAPILRMFADAAPDKVKLSVIDPDEQPLIAKNFGLVGGFGIYVSYLDATGQPDPRFTEQSRGDYARENLIAEAILQLRAKGQYRILFTIGHDEIGTDIEKKEDAYGIRAGAENVGIATGTIDLKNEDIPPGTTALVLLRPQRDFAADEVSKIAKYMADGGKLLIMAKPAYVGVINFMVPPDSPMATYLWENWGIRPQNDIVFDPDNSVSDPFRLLASAVSRQHPIMKRDAEGTTQLRPLLTIAQSWEISANKPDPVNIVPLIYTSKNSVGKKNLAQVAANPNDPANLKVAQGDLPGPLVMAAALENTKSHARLIVIGDADWAYNDTVQQFDGDLLWTNMIDWLTNYLSNISVQPKIKQLPLIVDTATLNIVTLISLVLLPGVVLFTGGLVWWDRVRRQ
ncbi:MAG: Gldg family protein [Chloroflexota bacterium]